ncbi:nucleotide-binding domain-containing protein [Brassicibacter mesophilus]|uniref:nucleotide-binding domain-containing protein n=1 Tax=Brassicibacter mesophilus TaxID=745119 RepID=UPI003D24495D
MYNLGDEFLEFHNEKVKLSHSEKQKLRNFKKLNLDRLEAGLNEINEEKNKSYKIVKSYEQGSVAMNTVTQNDNNEYDIDIAVIFEKDNIPSIPLDARKLVADALKRKCTNFAEEPTARTNAVTVWYKDGYHVDFAVYRQYEDYWENTIREHGGVSWIERDPTAITEWFNNAVKDKSPKVEFGATVEAGQMKRIVRLLKMFCKSRLSWSLPGGLIISVLVEECYKSDYHRDDVAFYDTIKAIYNRLQWSLDVYNPIHTNLLLNDKDEHTNKIKRLKEKLEDKLECLDVLFEYDCTEKKAKKAWKKFFKHDYWTYEEAIEKSSNNARRDFAYGTYYLDVDVAVYFQKNGRVPIWGLDYKRNYIMKKKWVRFVAEHNIPYPYSIKWEVYNTGDEAEEKNDMYHVTEGTNLTQWESTAYRGSHELICSVLKDGIVVARKVCEISIA